MKKTSKKLLSFFLAVVMIVTSCSIGFTAFAAESKKTMWNTSNVDPSASFKALDELASKYLPSLLMGIGAVKDGVFTKYASEGKLYSQLTATEKAHSWDKKGNLVNADKAIYSAENYKKFDRIEELKKKATLTNEETQELKSLQRQLFFTAAKENEVASKVTMTDVLGALQPTLIGALAKTSQSEFAKWFNTNFSSEYGDITLKAEDFDYLNDNGLLIDYFTITMLCYENRDIDELKEWYDNLIPLAKLAAEKKLKEKTDLEIIESIAKQINGNITLPPNHTIEEKKALSYSNATLYDLKRFTFDFNGNEALIEQKIAEFNEMLKALNSPITVSDFAEYVYYYMGAGSVIANSLIPAYYDAIQQSGSKVLYSGTTDAYNLGDFTYDITTDITPSNYDTTLTGATLAAAGVTQAKDIVKTTPAYNYDDKIAELEAAKAAAAVVETDFAQYKSELDVLVSNYKTNDTGAQTKRQNNARTYFGNKNYTYVNSTYVDPYQQSNNIKPISGVTAGSIGTLNTTYRTTIDTYLSSDFKKSADYDIEIANEQELKADYENESFSEDYAKSYLSMCNNSFYKNIIYGGSSTIGDSSCFIDILKGLAIKYGDNVTVDTLNSAALANMPKGTATCTLTSEEFDQLADAISYTGNLTDDFWSNGTMVIGENTVSLPDCVVDTAVAKYFSMIDINDLEAAFSVKDMDAVNGFFADALDYSYNLVVKDILEAVDSDISLTFLNSNTKNAKCNLDIDSFISTQMDIASTDIELTSAQKDVLYARGAYLGDYDFTDAGENKIGTKIVNNALNNTVLKIIKMELGDITIEDLINDLLVTKVNLVDVLEDIWNKLVASPVETVFNLVPVLVTVVEELLVPLLLNEENDAQYSTVTGLFKLVNVDGAILNTSLFYENGSPIGVNQLRFDLNTILPNLLHWITGDTDYDGYIKRFDARSIGDIDFVKNTSVTDTEGNPLTVNEGSYTYLGSTYASPYLLSQDYPDAKFLAKVGGIEYYNDGDNKTVFVKSYNKDDGEWHNSTYKANEVDKIDFDTYDVWDESGNPLTCTVDSSDPETKTYKYLGKTYNSAKEFANKVKSTFNCTYTYYGVVPFITGVYLVDSLFTAINITDKGIFTVKNGQQFNIIVDAIDYTDKKDADGNVIKNENGDAVRVLKTDDKGKPIKSPSDTALALSEAISEIATLLTASVDKYLESDYRYEASYNKDGDKVNSGLNNLFVALPRLFDIMENLAADKYGIDKNDWVYCYDGKIQNYTQEVYQVSQPTSEKIQGRQNPDTYRLNIYSDGTETCLYTTYVKGDQIFNKDNTPKTDKDGNEQFKWVAQVTEVSKSSIPGGITPRVNKNCSLNSQVNNIKSIAINPNPVDVLDIFSEILVENWLDSILTLVSNIVSTDNKISEKLPIIAGLLNSLGGFGEQSIITDIVNSVFQLTRADDYSFTFTTQHTDANNKMNGWNKDNAYFLICNIPRLVEVVTNLVDSFKGDGSDDGDNDDADNNNNNDNEDKTPTYKPGKTVDAKASSANYSSSDLSNTKDLIKNLDTMLSSLLSDSTLNDFSLGSTETILSGITSLLNKYLSDDITIKTNKKDYKTDEEYQEALGKNETITDILRLVNKYLYYITGEENNVVATKDNEVNPKTTYSNNALTGLVVETYALIEKIADSLLDKKFTNSYENGTIKYNLLVEAIDGIIAPDAIALRLGDYPDAQNAFTETKYKSWTEISKVSSRDNYKTLNVDWGFKDGDKEGFYDGLAASLRLVSTIVGILLVDTGWYNTVVTPVLGALCDKNGIKLTPYKTLVNSKNATGYYDETLKAVISPLAQFIDALLSAPASTLIKAVQGIAGILDDNNTKAGTINSILSGAITPIAKELKGAAAIFSIKSADLNATSPTLTKVINNLAGKIEKYSNGANIKLGGKGYKYGLSGKNLIPIINSYLAKTGITLKQISWSKLYSSTPEAALVYVLEYVLETVLDNKNLTALAGLIDNDIVTLILDAVKAGKINAKDILGLLNTILEATDSPTLVYWSFAQYLQELTENFKYPKGITKAMADMGVENLDGLVESIFPLLASLGVDLGGDSLKALVNNKLFTNKLLTTIATALYGALDGLDPTIKSALAGMGIVTSTKDIAKILTDKSYGATYTSAANTIKAQSSWKNVKDVNWGFKDGSAKAQQGFVNALAAILRPINGVLQIFLNEGNIKLNDILGGVIDNLTIDQKSTVINIADGVDIKLTYSMNNGILTLKAKNSQSDRSATSTIKLDLRSLKNLDALKIEGTNGYNSAIIPLLEAFGCTGIKTYKEYQKDVKNAKDNALLDILNPLLGAKDSSFLNKLLAAPVKELTALLPSIAMYLDSHGLSQLLNNLLAPVTNIIAEASKALKIDTICNELLGMSIADIVSALLGVDVDLDLADLSKLNIEDIIIPIVRLVLGGLDNEALRNLEIFDIDWNALISLGTKATYTSKATGADGKQLTGKMLKDVDSGKVLITVLRYVAKTLIANASVIKNLVCGIDAVAKNDLIKTIVSSVFNTIGTAGTDELVAAVFYLFAGNPTNAFWDYTSYKTGNYSFTYPGTVDVDFLKNLPPMLDGLIGGLIDLNGLISEKLFTDELVAKLATALYGAIEGVNVGESNLTALLAQTDIDFSTENVAKLLTDKDYGQTFDSAASVIKSAGSWKNIKAESLKFGVTDRDSFFHALVAVLRPIYGVLDVLLNDASLSIFNIVHIPGSDGYTSSIVPLMEAFSCYNIKTQYQYREDATKEYDALLLDIINPIWDKVEDILAAPLQTLTSMLPNLALLIGNDGLCQILDNLLTPVSALLDAIRPVIDLNDLLPAVLSALKVDLNSLLGKVGIKNFKLDIYDINKTLKPILGGDSIIPLVNNILGLIKIKGTPLGIKLNDVDWLQLASHGKTIIGASQAATYGARIFVEGDSSETLIAVLRYLIDTVNAGDNFKVISSLIASLLGDNISDSISDVIDQVLGMLQGDTDEVISQLVDLLQTFA